MNRTSLRVPRNVVPGTALRSLIILAVGLLLCTCLFVPRAMADIYTLDPGGNITASSSVFPTGGTVVATNGFAFNSATLDGIVLSRVYQGDPSNPYGGLTFTYSLIMFSGSSDSLSELTVGSYGGLSTDVSYNSIGGVAPSNFTRSAGDGDTLRFFFSNNGGILPGQPGDILVVQTSATSFGTAMGGVIDSIPANVTVLAPVPEPAIGSLCAIALGALLFRRRSS